MRPEDIAYSMLGLFDIKMPLLYGEGATDAFYRLQEEIIKRSSDHSIFGWDAAEHGLTSVLALSPREFLRGSESLQPNEFGDFPYQRTPYEMTNMGLRIRLPIIRLDKDGDELYLAVLDFHTGKSNPHPKCIALKRMTEDGTQFSRLHLQKSYSVIDCMGLPCLVMEIYIQHGFVKPNNLTMTPLPSTAFRWSTADLQEANELRSLGITSADQGSHQQRRNVQQFLYAAFKVSLIILIFVNGIRTMELNIYDIKMFLAATLGALCYLHCYFFTASQYLWYLILTGVRHMVLKIIRHLDGKKSRGHLQARSTNVIYEKIEEFGQILRRYVEAWASRTGSNAQRWNDASTLQLFSFHPARGLYSSDLYSWAVLIYYFNVAYWWRTFWFHAALATALHLAYPHFFMHIISYLMINDYLTNVYLWAIGALISYGSPAVRLWHAELYRRKQE